jgi:MtrB/PioB family decaheme-associated outer membrane protein
MLKRAGLVQGCLVGAVLSATTLFATDALAQQGCCQGGSATGANAWTDGSATSAQWPSSSQTSSVDITALPVKAPPAAALVPYWWYHGEIEIGGRDFVNNPNKNGSIFGNVGTADSGYTFFGQHSLAKYYEYGIVAPGAFGGGHIAAGSRDGLYQVDLWANNVASNFAGFSDQSYLLTASKIGEQYLTVGWDQTPHVYSTSAQTPYLGVGTSALTLPAGAAFSTNTPALLVPFLHQQDIGINRDTASVGYRWTPTEPWDFNVDYSYMNRTGTQVAGVVGPAPNATSRTSSALIEVPAPVNDHTQNYGANGEYLGTSFWGQQYTIKLAYNGSQYTDTMSSYTVQNPYCNVPTMSPMDCGGLGSPPSTFPQSPFARMPTSPSNQANGFGATMAADLPLQSRYMGTLNYTMMTQDAAFLPMTDNPFAFASPFGGGASWNSIAALPATSLNGQINTLLSNNVVTTKITPELTSKLTYRYYNFDNETPQIIFPCWVSVDQTGPQILPSAASPCGAKGTGSDPESTISSLTISYVKQNAGYALNWRPWPEWNFNAAYGYERYNYTQVDYNITNENSVKLSAGWTPTTWFTLRADGYYANRRWDNHDYFGLVKSIQFPTIPPFAPTTSSWFYSPAYQQFMFDNRQQIKSNLAADIVLFRGVTVTPTFKYQDDDYGLNPLNEEGVNYNHQISAGVDVGWVISPNLSVAVSYYWENYNLQMFSNSSGNGTDAPPFGAGQVVTFDHSPVNTLTAAVDYVAIPDKLNFDVRYTISKGVDNQTCNLCDSPAFPTNTTLFQHLDATAMYKLDPTFVRQMGWKGDVKWKLRYTWERNSVSNWQSDSIAPFSPAISSTMLWLAYNNPNYNVQMVAASLIATW